MGAPVQLRVPQTRRGGAHGARGLDDYRSFFAPEPMAAAHYEWRTLPITVKTLRAIRDLAMRHPEFAGLTTQDMAVQYGITVGLDLAADLIDDPGLVLRGLFGSDEADAVAAPTESFEEPQDIML